MTSKGQSNPQGRESDTLDELINKIYIAGYQAGKKSGLTMVLAAEIIYPEAKAKIQSLITEAREIFVPIHGTEGRYEVSNFGRVRSVAGGRRKGGILKQCIRSKNSGYMVVSLYKGKQVMSVTAHRLVANAFISNPDSKPCVNHKDGDKTNNHVENLEWVTYSENERHAYDVLGKVNSNKGNFATVCLDGHALAGDNVGYNGNGYKYCKQCAARRATDYRKRKDARIKQLEESK